MLFSYADWFRFQKADGLRLFQGRALSQSLLIGRLAELLRCLKFHGLKYTTEYVMCRLSDHYYERQLGFRSEGCANREELGLNNSFYESYAPISCRQFQFLLSKISIKSGTDVFLDYGAGKGRAVIMAARYGFREIIGVEISSSLCAIAEENVQRARKKLKCQNVRIINTDASQYEIPDNVNVIYFYHPFRGPVLRTVIDNIEASLTRRKRRIRILFFNHEHFDIQAGGCPWLMKRHEYFLLPPTRCAIYDCRI